MSTNKKMKTAANSDEEFEKVKKYLLECPHVSGEHPAIKAAVAAIEKEQQRMDRDRKLQLKFSKEKKTTVSVDADQGNLEDSVVVVESRSSSPPTAARTDDSADEMMEWQDVEEKGKEAADDQTSYLGKNLSKQAIDAISEYKVKVKSPVAAIAVALHASIRSQVLGFSCTGVPEDVSAKGGFAPPVRELPKNQFLPAAWDTKPNKIAIRYRKSGTGALVLTVEQGEDQNITVRLQPASSKEPSSQTLVFSLGDHVNLDSWNAALKTAPSVSPALHYKSLALLLTNFCRTFDLGSVDEDMSDRAAASIPYVDNTAVSMAQTMQKSDFIPARPAEIPSLRASSQKPRYDVPTTLGEAFPGMNPLQRIGDFAGDLAPAGLRDPVFPSAGDGRMGGNLMGPNHPMFQGGGGGMVGPGGLPLGGPGSMQPRFDPIYPEGIDFPNGGGQPGRRSNRPSRSGEPNPDHLPPPNAFGGGGDNMFS